MKQIILLILLFSVVGSSMAQTNLVPNGTFDVLTENYNGGSNPVNHYTAGTNCVVGRQRFEDEIYLWKVAVSDAALNQLESPFVRRCSPDWIAGYAYDSGTQCTAPESSFYLSHGLATESVMIEMTNGYKLIKGETYKFTTRVRSARGKGSFQLVFSSESDGLRVASNKKWTAGDFYFDKDCEWRNLEYYFTVPTNNDKKYEDMKYLILQFNHEVNLDVLGEKIAMHYDDVILTIGQPCEDIKYIQDWQYHKDSKFEQANQAIYAGSNVSPYTYYEIGPVIVKNSSKIIYRAPTIFLEPGFSVEAGAYFETQIGTCIENPCPSIPQNDISDQAFCSVPQKLGGNLPEIPGVFYSWSPANYFSDPSSRITNFQPPQFSIGSCLEATLTVSTICGASQSFPFAIRYYSAPPEINTAQATISPSGISGNLILTNASSYTIETFNPLGQILNSNTSTIDCGNTNGRVPIQINYCNTRLCEPLVIKITARNGCFPEVSKTINWTPPTNNTSPIIITNQVIDDYNFSFDYQLPSHYEFFTISVYDETGSNLICTNPFSACIKPFDGNTYSFNASSCLGCVSQCNNYRIVIEQKQFCGETVTMTIDWFKTNSGLQFPPMPNVITPNGDGINDELCFTPIGADWYHIVVVDRWGLPVYENSGCVNESPICLWTPNQNSTATSYFYTIAFSNQCGELIEGQSVLQSFANFTDESRQSNDINTFNNSVQIENSDISDLTNLELVKIIPNPFIEELIVLFEQASTRKMEILDSKGNIVISTERDQLTNTIQTAHLSRGIYYIHITSNEESIFKKIEKF